MSKIDAVDVYLDVIKRIEPDITMIDNGAAAASMSISLKRIADSLEYIVNKIKEEERNGK